MTPPPYVTKRSETPQMEGTTDGPLISPEHESPFLFKQELFAVANTLGPASYDEHGHQAPADWPEHHKTEPTAYRTEGVAPPPPVCIPPGPDGLIVGDPAPDPAYTIGQEVTFSEVLGSVGITEPKTYQWALNGSPTVTTETYTITVTDGMITDKDETGLGIITISVTVTNACGEETYTGTFPAQGDPPP